MGNKSDLSVGMTDFRRVIAHCRMQAAAGEEISDECARVIAAMYHHGQRSLAYAFASTGRIPTRVTSCGTATNTDALWCSMFSEYARYTDDARLIADMFGTYLTQRVRDDRIDAVEGWSSLWLND